MRRFLFGLAFLALAAPVAHANDDQIAQQIVTSLKACQAEGDLKHFNIGLRVRDGNVFLNGHVANAGQERLAVATARAVEGVGKVVSEIKIRDNATRLVKHTVVKAAEPALEPAPAPTVHVASLQEEEEPQEEASSEAPVQLAVLEDNQAEPTVEAAPVAGAKEIATEIIRRLKEKKDSGELRGFGIDVEVEDGQVWLKGRVSSRQQQKLALQTVRIVPGVKKVVNELSIASQTSRTQAATPAPAPITTVAPVQAAETVDASDELARLVVRRLQEQKKKGNLKDFGIDVKAENGVVWLSGYVSTKGQQRLALDMARFATGCKKVVNDLQVVRTTAAKPAAPAELAAPAPQVVTIGATMPVAQNTPATTPAAPAQTIQGQAYTLVPVQHMAAQTNHSQTPLAFAPARRVNHSTPFAQPGSPMPMQMGAPGVGVAPARFDHPQMPGYAWPSYAAYPNYGAVTYPRQYSASAWPYIGPFYPYPQVPLGWRKVTLEWDDGWWFLDFKNRHHY